MFADNIKLWGTVDSCKGRKASQKNVDRLEIWATTNCMKFNKNKSHLGWGNPGYMYQVGDERLESSLAE